MTVQPSPCCTCRIAAFCFLHHTSCRYGLQPSAWFLMQENSNVVTGAEVQQSFWFDDLCWGVYLFNLLAPTLKCARNYALVTTVQGAKRHNAVCLSEKSITIPKKTKTAQFRDKGEWEKKAVCLMIWPLNHSVCCLVHFPTRSLETACSEPANLNWTRRSG